MRPGRLPSWPLWLALTLTGCDRTEETRTADELNSETQELVSNRNYWPTKVLGTEVTTCWYPMDNDQINGSITWERDQIRDTIQSTWAGLSSVYFTGWGGCTLTPATQDVRIQIRSATCQSAVGPSLRTDWSMRIRPAHIDGAYWMRNCARHEMGHALGFHHEHERTDAFVCSWGSASEDSNATSRTRDPANHDFVGPYDPSSIMNYCYFMPSRTSQEKVLSPLDIQGLRLTYGGGSGLSSNTYLFGDVNADGRDDVVMPWTGPANTVSVSTWRSNGAGYTDEGTFSFQRRVSPEANPMRYALADLNADQRADLIEFTSGRAYVMWASATSQAFGQAIPYDFDLADPDATSWVNGRIELDGDGRQEFVQVASCGAGWGSTRFRIHTWKGSYFNTYDSCQTSSVSNVLAWLTGDTDLDGRTDIIQVRYRNDNTLGLVVYQGRAAGDELSFQDRGEAVPGAGTGALKFLAGDVDGDQRTEVFQLWNDNGKVTITIFKFDPATQKYVRAGDSRTQVAPGTLWLALDMTGDGKTDIVQLSGDANGMFMTVFQAAASGTHFGALPTVSFAGASWNSRIGFNPVDVDGDGKRELLETWNYINRSAVHTAFSSRVENLALGRSTAQSSTDWGGVSSRAVDGNPDGVYAQGSITSTAYQHQPWWQVDLGQSRAISDILLHNRNAEYCDGLPNGTPAGDCRLRLRQFKVRLSDDQVTWQDFPYSGDVFQQRTFAVNRSARYVRIQLDDWGTLSLAEVVVLGNGHNLAQGMAAAHWPDYTSAPSPAARVVDGRVDGFFELGSVNHTGFAGGAWVDVPLGSERVVDRVVIYNRTDCCQERLSGTGVWTQDNAGTWNYLGVLSGTATSSTQVFTFPAYGVRASRVFMQRVEGSAPLNLAEVQVFGRP